MLALLLVAVAAAATDVQIKTADGQTLRAASEPVPGSKHGVVLVHGEGGTAGEWSYLASRLAKSGLPSLAPDLRGHGKNPKKELTEADWKAMTADVEAAVAWLRRQGVDELACVGASLGANLCAQVAARDPEIQNLVLLSPGLNLKGVTAGDALQRYGDRPVLIVASAEDAQAKTAATVLVNAATGQKQVEMLQNAGRGTRMLNQNANLEGLVLSWVLGTYQLSSGEIVTPKPAAADPGTVETTGKKLPGH